MEVDIPPRIVLISLPPWTELIHSIRSSMLNSHKPVKRGVARRFECERLIAEVSECNLSLRYHFIQEYSYPDRQTSTFAIIDHPHLPFTDRPQVNLDVGLPTWFRVRRHAGGNGTRARPTFA